MGGSVSFSYWTAEEQRENKTALELQEIAKEFIITNMYYGIPVRSGKISHDPRSPLWIELDPKVMEKARLGKGDIQMSLLETVPSAVSVNFQGFIKVMFASALADVEYDLHVRDVQEALSFDDPAVTGANSALVFVPTPNPPKLVKAEKHSIKLNWMLPQPPGISQQLELQFAMVTPEIYQRVSEYIRKLYELLDEGVNVDFALNLKAEDRDVFRKVEVDTHGLGTCSLDWASLATRTYHKSGFLNFILDNLLPGDCYCFRMRYLNHRGWSAYSHPSRIYETLPAPPSEPSAPICGYVGCTSVQLFWVPPFRDNGSPIKHYRLRGKSAGGDFVELFRGPNTSFLATDLHPEFIYSFEVAAVNTAGVSVWSLATSVTTPKSADKPRPRDPDSFEWMMALQFRDAWRELWDPKTEQVFYFNTITSTRQLEKPAALETDVDEDIEGNSYKAGSEGRGRRIENAAEAERRQEVEFRKKRYRLLRTIHASKGKPEKADTKSIELRRSNLLLDGFRKINAATAEDIRKRAKFSFHGEPGIDSGGVGKEAFLLLSRQATIYAGKLHRGWLFAPDKKTGGLFFTSGTESKIEVVPTSVKADANSEASEINDQSTPLIQHSLNEQTITDMANVKAPQFCRFLGRLLGKAIFDRQLIEMPLSKLLLKHMLGQNFKMPAGIREPVVDGSPSKFSNKAASPSGKSLFVSVPTNIGGGKEGAEEEKVDSSTKALSTSLILDDMKDLDLELHSSLVWMLENDITDIIYETFSIDVIESGAGGKKTHKIALCPNGESRDVTEKNKEEYVRLLVQWKTHYAVSSSLDPMLLGFHELVNLNALQDCNIEPHELDLMLHGKVIVDVDELRAYCIYQCGGGGGGGSDDVDTDVVKDIVVPWGEQHEIVVWLWQALRDLSQNEVRLIICFFTGSARIPLDGYDPPLNITQGVDMDEEALPRAHTCFNQLVIPPYKSYNILKEKLILAAKETEGFSLS